MINYVAALEAYLLAGEDVPDDSPLLSFPTLTAAAAATSAAASGERERPSLADCEALLQQLQQFKGKEKACEALKVSLPSLLFPIRMAGRLCCFSFSTTNRPKF